MLLEDVCFAMKMYTTKSLQPCRLTSNGEYSSEDVIIMTF